MVSIDSKRRSDAFPIGAYQTGRSGNFVDHRRDFDARFLKREEVWRDRTAFARTPPRVSRLGTGRTELAYCRAIYVYGVPHPAVPVCPDRSRRTIIHKTKPSEKTSFQPIEFFLAIVKNSFQWAFFI